MVTFTTFITESKTPKVFYHLSKDDRSRSGISRKYAGSHAAGAEKKRFKFVDGQLDEDTAMVHLYTIDVAPEVRVTSGAKWFHRIELPRIKLVDVEDQAFQKIIDGVSDMSDLPKAVRKAGYDGIYNYAGMVQIYRDISKKEIVFAKLLEPGDHQLMGKKKADQITP